MSNHMANNVKIDVLMNEKSAIKKLISGIIPESIHPSIDLTKKKIVITPKIPPKK